jgi:hypothetical protein
MVQAEGVELQQGAAPWMRLAHLAASLLAATAVLAASASPSIKLLLIVSLSVVHLATARRMRRSAALAPRVRLFEDGRASVLTRSGAVPALLQGSVWSSRWFSAFRLQRLDGQGPLDCVICRSANPSEAYRRLRVMLRLQSGLDSAAHWGRQ